MINFHPGEEQLELFAAGNLAPTLALMVSAHCDLCPECMSKLAALTSKVAEKELSHSFGFEQQPDHMLAFGDMFEKIAALPTDPKPVEQLQEECELDLDGKRFILPRSLRRYADKTGNWKRLVGKLWQAQVDIGGDARAEFIYMEQGGSVPEHTHKGNEWTLVVNGEFEDGHNKYESGDLILLDDTDIHTPVSNDPDGCLVFSIVDKPLHFTSGLARLLNPFSHLFFK